MTRPIHVCMVNVNGGVFEEWKKAFDAILEVMDLYQSDTLPEIKGVLAYEYDFFMELTRENFTLFQQDVTAPRFIRSVPYTPLERVVSNLENLFDMSRCTHVTCFNNYKTQGDIIAAGTEMIQESYPNQAISWIVEPLSPSSIEAWKATMEQHALQTIVPDASTPKSNLRL